ncbi:MAG: hypothetical protein JWO71_4089 [Candidatus Acidoferrum typicum]|nr:hypothetical protein [Candidatus Acidoferrum typicum]
MALGVLKTKTMPSPPPFLKRNDINERNHQIQALAYFPHVSISEPGLAAKGTPYNEYNDYS